MTTLEQLEALRKSMANMSAQNFMEIGRDCLLVELDNIIRNMMTEIADRERV